MPANTASVAVLNDVTFGARGLLIFSTTLHMGLKSGLLGGQNFLHQNISTLSEPVLDQMAGTPSCWKT